jgi:predicted Holliday junction resolvase-like endonuclease
MRSIKQWYIQWFPLLDTILAPFSPWIIDGDNADTEIDDLIFTTVRAAYDASLITDVIGKGYRIIEGADQIILAADMSEAESMDKLNKYYQVLSDSFKKLNIDMPHVIGVFLLSSSQDTESGDPGENSSVLLSDMMKWAGDKLCKVFLLDNVNGYMVIKNPADKNSLVGQLLYFLARKPVNAERDNNFSIYTDWLTADKNPEDSIVNSISAVSLCTPIDQVIETLLVRQSGSLLQEAFIDPVDNSNDIAEDYNLSFCNKVMLNSYESLVETYHRDILNPFSEAFPVFNIENPKQFCHYADEIDRGMPNYVDTNSELMKASGDQHIGVFTYSYDEHVAKIISSEKGCFPVASAFFEKTKEHLTSIIPEDPPLPKERGYEVAGAIQQLLEETENGPGKKALIIRSLILISMFLLTFITGDFSYYSFIFLAVAIIVSAGSVFYWNGWKTRMGRMADEIKENLEARWKKEMAEETHNIICQAQPLYQEVIESSVKRVQNAGERLSNVINYFRNEYKAPEPEDTAFWLYPVDFISYQGMMKQYETDFVHSIIKDEEPLQLWQRLVNDGAEINRWEWELAEKVAIRMMPYCSDILNESICALIIKNRSQLENLIALFKKLSPPFLRLRPGKTSGLSGVLEAYAENCGEFITMLQNMISDEYSSSIQVVDSNTPYRITLFSLLEGIGIKNIITGGAE